jgi:hypothetical protein
MNSGLQQLLHTYTVFFEYFLGWGLPIRLVSHIELLGV